MKQRGFSLIEFLVAMSIFAIVIIVVLGSFAMVIKGQRKVIAMQNVQENTRFLLDFMTKEIRMSTINAATENTITIVRSDNQVVTYTFSGNNIERTSPSSSGPINSEEVLVNGRFYAEGIGTGDGQQPKLTIAINVQSAGNQPEEQSRIDLQTTLSQRLIDL
jgi:prepilin-type N-terminal cleavage/methylation domain-containing protein